MKPVKLNLKGINSFEDMQEIDFERLASLGLFGIFGATGSGKSTIIDAITLALYGKLSRYDGNSYCPFINANCDDAFVRFEFEILEDGNPVTVIAEREYKKKETEKSKKNIADGDKKKHGVRTSFRRLYKKSGDDVIILSDKNEAEMTKAVIDLIGLKYDDFLKTVILPQGKFSGFLMLENKERRDMLERIFQLGHYGERLHAKIKEALNNSNARLSALDQTRAKYENISEDAVAEAQRQLADSQQKIARLKQEEAETRLLFNQYKELNDSHNECTAYEEQKAALEEALPIINRNRETVAKAKKAAQIQPLFADYETASRNYEENTHLLQQQEAALSSATERQKAVKALYDQAFSDKQTEHIPLLNRENSLTRAIELSDEIDALQKERQVLLRNYQAEEQQLTALKKNAESLAAEEETIRNGLTGIDTAKREIIIDTAEKQKIYELFEKNNVFQRLWKTHLETLARLEKLSAEIAADQRALSDRAAAQARLEKKMAENQALLTALTDQCPGGADGLIRLNNEYARMAEAVSSKKRLQTELADAETEQARLSASCAEAQQAQAQIAAEWTATTDRYKELSAQMELFKNNHMIAVIAAGLREGESCPVCGATSHPHPAQKIADGLLDILATEKKELEKTMPGLETGLKKAEFSIAGLQKDIGNITAKISELLQKIGDFSLEASEQNLAAAKTNIDGLDRNIREWQSAKESAEKAAADDRQTGSALAVETAALNERLKKSREQQAEIQASLQKTQTEINDASTIIDALKQALALTDEAIESTYHTVRKNELINEKLEKEEKMLRERLARLTDDKAAIADDRQEREKQMEAILTSGKEKKSYIDQKRAKYSELRGDAADVKEALTETRQRITALLQNEERLKKEQETAAVALKQAEELKIGLKNRNGMLKTILDETESKKTLALTAQGFTDAQAFKDACAPPEIIDALENEIKSYEETALRVADNLNRLYVKLEGVARAEIAPAVASLREKTEAVAEALAQKLSETGGLQARISNLEKMLADLRALEKESASEKHRNDLLAQLAKLFSGNRFVEFVAKRQLRNITIEASRWLGEMSRGRYAVELDEATFVIRDDFNGGKRRPPTTLSGGEIFMVSLCLALALSSKVQLKNRTPLDFFFLDEGFGTLDGFVLDMVMKCLDMLKAEGMKIGLISHVEELKHRIEKKLIVEKTEDGIGGARVLME